MKFSIFQESRIGKRKINQDRMSYAYTRDSLMMVVADGMGGHLFGELAAQITVQTISDSFKTLARTTLTDPFLFLSRSISQSHLAINKYAHERSLADAPRTTCVVCIIQCGIAYWAHVGDSRLYAIRDGKTLAQTRDHSHVNLLVDQGAIEASAAGSHPARNLVYSCLGGPNPPEIEFSRKIALQQGDVIALCTDGAWAPFADDTLVRTLSSLAPEQAVPQLLDQAEQQAGSHSDNLTLMAMQWENTGVEEPLVASTSVLAPVQSMPSSSNPTPPDPRSVIAVPLDTPE
jgi:serine/threonine protein phosphatase PrpC